MHFAMPKLDFRQTRFEFANPMNPQISPYDVYSHLATFLSIPRSVAQLGLILQ